MRLTAFNTPDGSISDICDQIIHDSQFRSKSSRLKQFQKKPSFNYATLRNKETLELTKGLFDCVKSDNSSKVLCTDLIEHLISIGVHIDPVLFTQIFKKHLRVTNISLARIDPEEFNNMLFANKRVDKMMEIMKMHLKPGRAVSVFPKVRINRITLVSTRRNFKNNRENGNTEDYFGLVRQWWRDICPQGCECVTVNAVAQLLLEKEIANTVADAKKIFNNAVFITENDFLEVFCVGIVKLQVLEAAKKVNQIGLTKPFLSPYQKLSSVKRKLLISRISPERSDSKKTYAEKVVNGLINYRILKTVLK